MKHTQLLLCVAIALFALLGGMAGASQSRTFEDALKKAGTDKAFVMFCYGANYDDISIKMYETYIKKHEKNMYRVLNSTNYLVVPVYQLPNEKEKREYERVMGKRGLPGGIWSVPCFAVVDGNGNVRGTVQAREELDDPVKAAAALSKLLDDFKEQQKLLTRAERASGKRKEELQREALSYTDLRVPNHALFDPSQNGVVQDLQIMSIPEANSYIRKLLANGTYSPVEQQMVMAAFAGHVRREKGPVAMLRALYTEMRNIDPTSTYGVYAEGALEIWVEPLEKEASSNTVKSRENNKQDKPAAQ